MGRGNVTLGKSTQCQESNRAREARNYWSRILFSDLYHKRVRAAGRVHHPNARPDAELCQSDTEWRLHDANARTDAGLCQSDTERRLHRANTRPDADLYQSSLRSFVRGATETGAVTPTGIVPDDRR